MQRLELFEIDAIPITFPEGERFSRLCLEDIFWIFAQNMPSLEGLIEELEKGSSFSCGFHIGFMFNGLMFVYGCL